MNEARRSYDDQLHEIRDDVVKLAARVREQIGAATESLLAGDLVAVERVYADREEILDDARGLEQRAYQLLALQQPMAADLRQILTTLRVLHELELTSGLIRNVARATRRLYPGELAPRVRGIIDRMGEQASVQMQLAIDCYAGADVTMAAALPDMDDVMDDLQKELFRAIFALGAPDESALQRAIQITFVGRDYERAADHAVTIGRWVGFMVTGTMPGSGAADLTS